MQEITTIGLDIAKSVFQVHGIDASGAVIVRRQLRRRQVLPFFRKRPACGHCQTNLNGPAKGAGLRRSGRQLTPLGQGGRTVLLEDVAAVEVAVVVEVVVD